VKEFLSREGVAFTVKNVDEDDQAYSELVARGFRSIPVTIVGEQAIRGYDEPALRAAIARGPDSGAA
jgi:glutaredoxin-like protein NrdH